MPDRKREGWWEGGLSEALVKRDCILPGTPVDLGAVPVPFLNESSGEHTWGEVIADTRKPQELCSRGVHLCSIADSVGQSCYKVNGTHHFMKVILAECPSLLPMKSFSVGPQ